MPIRYLALTVILAQSAACKKKDGPTTQVASFDTQGSDSLWALAPEGTVIGIVAAPAAGTRLHGMVGEIYKVLQARPLGRALVQEFKAKASANTGFDMFDEGALRAHGFDISLGAAFFFTMDRMADGKDKSGYMVVPVSDRKAFRDFLKGTVESAEGIEFDRYKDDLVCVSKDSRYLCSNAPANLKSFGTSVNSGLAQQVTKLPQVYRGPIEFAVDSTRLPQDDLGALGEFFEKPGTGVIALRMERGALTVRGWLQAKLKTPAAELSAVSTVLSREMAAEHPSGSLVIRYSSQAIQKGVSGTRDQQLPGGLSLNKDILANLTGEIAMYSGSGSSMWGRISLGLVDATPFQTLLNMGCGLLPAANIAGITVKPGDGLCHVTVDVAKLPLPDPAVAAFFPEPIVLQTQVTKDRLAVTIGTESPPAKAPPSAIEGEILGRDWNTALWVKDIAIAQSVHPFWGQIAQTTPSTEREKIQLGIWVLAHLNELGMAGAVRKDGIHGMLHIGTYAADPDPTYAAFQSTVTASIDEQKDTFTELAQSHANSLAGRGNHRGGSMLLSAVTGAVAAVAIPAFMKYQRRSQAAMEKMQQQLQADQEAIQAAMEPPAAAQ